MFQIHTKNHSKVVRQAIEMLHGLTLIEKDDYVLVTKGDIMGMNGRTNMMQVVQVP